MLVEREGKGMVVGSFRWGGQLWGKDTYRRVVDYWLILGTKLYNNLNDYLIFVGLGLVVWKNGRD